MQRERRSDKCKQARANFLSCIEGRRAAARGRSLKILTFGTGLILIGAQQSTPSGAAARCRETTAAQYCGRTM